MRARFSRYDVADYLRNRDGMAAYLEACFEEAGDDAATIAAALGDIAREVASCGPAPGGPQFLFASGLQSPVEAGGHAGYAQ